MFYLFENAFGITDTFDFCNFYLLQSELNGDLRLSTHRLVYEYVQNVNNLFAGTRIRKNRTLTRIH